MSEQPEAQQRAREEAEKFHDTYERLAPSFGYETRKDTKRFDPESSNGKLMVAVCQEILQPLYEEVGRLRKLHSHALKAMRLGNEAAVDYEQAISILVGALELIRNYPHIKEKIGSELTDLTDQALQNPTVQSVRGKGE